MNLSVDRLDPHFVDCLTHHLTGAQILFHLFHSWDDEPNRAITLWCAKGSAVAKAKTIRVALSKERFERQTSRTFELRFSEPWPHTHNGIKGEAINVRKDMGTMTTRLNAAFARLQERN